MLHSSLHGIEMSALGQLLRSSLWLYPVANTLHVLAVATLFGAILITDLRLLGLARTIGLAELLRFTLPLAWSGFALAALTGALMFVADARVFANNPFFLTKLGLLILAGINAYLFHRFGVARAGTALPAVSLGLWIAVVVCGRAIAYW